MVAKYKTSYLRQQRKQTFKKRLFCFLMVGFLIGLVYIVFFSNLFDIKNIEVTGTARIPESIIYSEVSTALNDHSSWPLSNNLLFANVVLGKKQWNNDIEKVSIKRNFFSGGIKVSVTEKQPIAKIIIVPTGVEMLLAKEKSSFFIDSAGSIFKSKLEPKKILPEISFTSSVEQVEKINWDAYRVASFMKLLEYFYQDGTFDNDNLKFSYSLNRPNAIVHHFDEHYDIYLTLNKDIDEAFKSAVGFANKTDGNKTTILNYIDARFYPEKLYYK